MSAYRTTPLLMMNEATEAMKKAGSVGSSRRSSFRFGNAKTGPLAAWGRVHRDF